MWDDIKAAARIGIVEGVKWAVTAVLILLAVSWLLGDYTLVRQRAQNGQAAFEFIQRAQAQQRPAPQQEQP